MKILVGLSGGVDSSVAAFLLKQAGHDVIGATMSIWGKNGMAVKSGHKNACYGPDEKEDIEEARKIAEQIGIPYYVFDCSSQYEEIVLKNFKSEYLEGRTPNPCVWCNAYVKFGALPEIAKLNGVQFDKFATGHYVRIEEQNGHILLKKGIAAKKDQSYFLYRLNEEKLKNIIFPLGEYTKDEIRKIAQENGLLAAEKPDSQDFYGGDYNELLQIKDKLGYIVDTEGKILGEHKGIWNYTVGQRKGLGISSTEPLYVLSLNKDKNEVIVGHLDKTFKKSLIAKNLNWINFDKLDRDINVTAKIRSTQIPVPALVKAENDSGVQVIFDDYQKSIAIGQSVVFYDNDVVLGGGIIDTIL
ncbi:MAG: tRNA 2-thiouridine(34) synthase MnmA, partial [Candidatus Gastranaerophilales bacterium]|nr:tRNA 2-thiouridine(34) synthase MnmA [Candidatus Gastranaerophilales bacterium]